MIILASSSPRRKQLLKILGLEFTVIPSKIVENLNPRYKPEKQAELLSLQKAEEIAKKYPDALIISADTVIVYGNEVIGKPKDEEDAKRLLKKFSGTSHKIITGLTILDTKSKKIVTKSIVTTVWFRKLQTQEITNYIKKAKPFDKAGAYAIQDLGAIFIERLEGDYLAAVGLPLFTLAKELKKFGITVL